MKHSGRHLTKKGLTGLKRVGVGVERHWEYKGASYFTLREIWQNVYRQVRAEAERLAKIAMKEDAKKA